MHRRQQSGVLIHLHDAVDSPFIQFDVIKGRDRHEAVRRKRCVVDLRVQFPFAPSVVVFGDGEPERLEGFWLGKKIVAPFAREKTRQKTRTLRPTGPAADAPAKKPARIA